MRELIEVFEKRRNEICRDNIRIDSDIHHNKMWLDEKEKAIDKANEEKQQIRDLLKVIKDDDKIENPDLYVKILNDRFDTLEDRIKAMRLNTEIHLKEIEENKENLKINQDRVCTYSFLIGKAMELDESE